MRVICFWKAVPYLVFGSNFKFVNIFTQDELKLMRCDPSKTTLSFLPGLITKPCGVRCRFGMNLAIHDENGITYACLFSFAMTFSIFWGF